MEMRLLKIIIVISAMAAMVQTAEALNLGMLQKSLSANVSAGDTATFRVLFWSADEIGYNLRINKISVPEDWLIIVNPNPFLLVDSPPEKAERVYIPGAGTAINAKAADIYVTVPERETAGAYEIVLNAVAGDGKSAGFSLFQERKIIFKVNVVKGSGQKITAAGDNEPRRTVIIDTTSSIGNSNEISTYSANNNSREISTHPSDNFSGGINAGYQNAPYVQDIEKESKKPYLILILAAIIVLVAWRIYKYD